MVRRIDTASVELWGAPIGAVTWERERELGVFEYDPAFQTSGIELSPFAMPLGPRRYTFPALSRETFKGLPGLLADSLPDKFGSALIDQWLLNEGIPRADFSPVERLCYIGTRGMGALEFLPTVSRQKYANKDPLDISAMVELASQILTQREGMHGALPAGAGDINHQTLLDILQVGVSAGGARAKAVIAWNPETREVRSGQVALPPGFEHWVLKFDGVSNNRDKELADGRGYGLMEYAYYQMAKSAGIDMSECQILEENGRHHFMTRRFDRTASGKKLHMQSLGALSHFDFNLPGSNSYEQAMEAITTLDLGMTATEQMYRRALFNIMARNQDDHVKNIAFLMDTTGEWRLAPAYDLTFAFNPEGLFTSKHQMSLNGKRDEFTIDDLIATGKRFNMTSRRARNLIEEVRAGVNSWPTHARPLGLPEERVTRIQGLHRLTF